MVNLFSSKVVLVVADQQFLSVLNVMVIMPSGLSQQSRIGFDKLHPASFVLLHLSAVDSALIRDALQGCSGSRAPREVNRTNNRPMTNLSGS